MRYLDIYVCECMYVMHASYGISGDIAIYGTPKSQKVEKLGFTVVN